MTDDKENRYRQQSDDYPNGASYVYPDPNNNYNNNYSSSSGGKPPGDPRRSTRVIGIMALILAVAVIFSAMTGTAVYVLMRDGPEPTASNGQTTVPDNQTTVPQATDPAPTPTPVDRRALINPHFSLADAAGRSDADKQTLTIMEIAARGRPAVVAITTEMTVRDMFGQVYRPTAAGSGFIITEDGYIVTNNHVIEGADTITVVLDNDDVYSAVLVGADPSNDIAVIRIEETGLPTVVMGDSVDLQVGELAVAIGNPLGELSGSVTAGIISALDREITLRSGRTVQRLKLLQTDAAINTGNSGGALFNSFGEVIGINTAKNVGSGVEGLGFAIPIDHAKPIVESIIQHGYVRGRPKIGISARNVSAQMAEYYQLTEGIYVIEVESGSAADRAGLLVQDIIIAANGEEVLTIDALNDIKNTFKPGDTMTLTIVREDQEIDIEVILQEELPIEYTPTNYNNQPDFPRL